MTLALEPEADHPVGDGLSWRDRWLAPSQAVVTAHAQGSPTRVHGLQEVHLN